MAATALGSLAAFPSSVDGQIMRYDPTNEEVEQRMERKLCPAFRTYILINTPPSFFHNTFIVHSIPLRLFC